MKILTQFILTFNLIVIASSIPYAFVKGRYDRLPSNEDDINDTTKNKNTQKPNHFDWNTETKHFNYDRDGSKIGLKFPNEDGGSWRSHYDLSDFSIDHKPDSVNTFHLNDNGNGNSHEADSDYDYIFVDNENDYRSSMDGSTYELKTTQDGDSHEGEVLGIKFNRNADDSPHAIHTYKDDHDENKFNGKASSEEDSYDDNYGYDNSGRVDSKDSMSYPWFGFRNKKFDISSKSTTVGYSYYPSNDVNRNIPGKIFDGGKAVDTSPGHDFSIISNHGIFTTPIPQDPKAKPHDGVGTNTLQKKFTFGVKPYNSEGRTDESEDFPYNAGSMIVSKEKNILSSNPDAKDLGHTFGVIFNMRKNPQTESSSVLGEGDDAFDDKKVLESGVKPLAPESDEEEEGEDYLSKKKETPMHSIWGHDKSGDDRGFSFRDSLQEKWGNLMDTVRELSTTTTEMAKSAHESFQSAFGKVQEKTSQMLDIFKNTLFELGSMVHKGVRYMIQKIALTFDEEKGSQLLSKLQKKLDEKDETADEFFQKVGEKVTTWEEQNPHANVDKGLLDPHGEHVSKHFGDPKFSDLFQDEEIQEELQKMMEKGILEPEEVRILRKEIKNNNKNTKGKNY